MNSITSFFTNIPAKRIALTGCVQKENLGRLIVTTCFFKGWCLNAHGVQIHFGFVVKCDDRTGAYLLDNLRPAADSEEVALNGVSMQAGTTFTVYDRPNNFLQCAYLVRLAFRLVGHRLISVYVEADHFDPARRFQVYGHIEAADSTDDDYIAKCTAYQYFVQKMKLTKDCAFLRRMSCPTRFFKADEKNPVTIRYTGTVRLYEYDVAHKDNIQKLAIAHLVFQADKEGSFDLAIVIENEDTPQEKENVALFRLDMEKPGVVRRVVVIPMNRNATERDCLTVRLLDKRSKRNCKLDLLSTFSGENCLDFMDRKYAPSIEPTEPKCGICPDDIDAVIWFPKAVVTKPDPVYAKHQAITFQRSGDVDPDSLHLSILGDCSHIYHRQCIDKWKAVQQDVVCPCCRTSIRDMFHYESATDVFVEPVSWRRMQSMPNGEPGFIMDNL